MGVSGSIWTRLLVAAAAAVAMLVVWYVPFTVDKGVERSGRLLAGAVWTLERSGQGTLIARLDDRGGGVSPVWTVRSSQRGDAVALRLAPGIGVGSTVLEGDTLGVMQSAASARDEAILEAEAGIVRAERRALAAGAKRSLRRAAETRVAQLEQQVALHERIVERMDELARTGAGSADERDRAAGDLLAVAAELEAARANLVVLADGARPEDAAVADARRVAIDAARRAVFQLDEARAVTSPIGGTVVRPVGDSILVQIAGLDGGVVVFSLPVGLRQALAAGDTVHVEGDSGLREAVVSHVDATAHLLGSEYVVLVTARVDGALEVDGLPVTVHVDRPAERLGPWLAGLVARALTGSEGERHAPRG